jgi:predicted nucleic acid-binding Zn ribbon protein
VKEEKRGPRAIGELIVELLKSTVRRRRADLEIFETAWAGAVGAEVARHSRPLAYRNGELRVGFASAALRHEVESFRKAEILGRLRAACPERRIATLKCVLEG